MQSGSYLAQNQSQKYLVLKFTAVYKVRMCNWVRHFDATFDVCTVYFVNMVLGCCATTRHTISFNSWYDHSLSCNYDDLSFSVYTVIAAIDCSMAYLKSTFVDKKVQAKH
jgi:hypothetical protein